MEITYKCKNNMGSISGLAFVDGAEEEREANGVLVK